MNINIDFVKNRIEEYAGLIATTTYGMILQAQKDGKTICDPEIAKQMSKVLKVLLLNVEE